MATSFWPGHNVRLGRWPAPPVGAPADPAHSVDRDGKSGATLASIKTARGGEAQIASADVFAQAARPATEGFEKLGRGRVSEAAGPATDALFYHPPNDSDTMANLH
jgi:hypothetical protein